MREWVGSVPRQQQDETSFYMHTLQPLHENHLVWRRGDGEGSDKYKIKKKTPSDHLLLPCKYQATATSEAAQSVWWADTNGVIGKWFWDGGGETEDGRTWRINNDELSGTYAVTFINSLLMTYLAVVGLTCVYCVNVQTLRWGQMFGRHVCTLINSVHAQRSCVCVCLCARTQTSTPTITSTHRHTHTRPLSLDILWESRREESSFPFAACWYLSCQLSKPTAGSWTDPSAELQTPSKNI